MSFLGRLAAMRERSPRAFEAVAVILGALGIALAITWPLVTQLGSVVPGGGAASGGDRSGYVWDVWLVQEGGLDLWGVDTQEQVSQPFGREIPAAVYVLQLAFYGPAWALGAIVGPIPALNLTLLLLMTASAASMYLLVRAVGLGVGPAVWAMVAWSVFPNAIVRAVTHYPLAALACIPIVLLAAWRWYEKPGLLRASLLALAVGFCWLSNPYYGMVAFIVLGVVGIAGVVRLTRSGGLRLLALRAGELAGAVAILVALPLWALLNSSRDAVETTLGRDRGELALFGARITDYVLPDGRHRLFSSITEAVPELAAPGGERVNFIGYLTIVLAVVGCLWAARRFSERSGLVRTAVTTGPILAVVLIWFSLATPTIWAGVTIPTPSGEVFDALPFLRVYARFGVAVTAIAICLAAIGLAAILRGRRPAIQAAVVAVACVITLAELPPGGGLPVGSTPPILVSGVEADDVPIWAWLRDNSGPGDLVYNFPAHESEIAERFHMYGQLVHGRAIVNGDATRTGLGTDLTSVDRDPREPESAVHLASIGVDYVTISPHVYGLVRVDPPVADEPAPGYELVKAFADGSAIWRPVAPPDGGIAVFHRFTWWPPNRAPDGREWRFLNDRARVTVWAAEDGRYKINFGMQDIDPGSGRGLEIVLPDDGGSRRLRPRAKGDVSFEAPLRAGRNEITVRLTGRRARLISQEDPRLVSLQISDWTVTEL